MSKPPQLASITDDVVSDFLAELEKSDIESNVTDRLRTVLQNSDKISETELRNALFSSDAS